MKFLDTHDMYITPLSPVHMGCGEVFEPTQYVIDGQMLYEFDPVAAAGALPPAARGQLLERTAGPGGQTMLTAVQKLFHEQRKALMPIAISRVPVTAEMASFHRSRVGQVAQTESSGRQLLNRLDIERTAYSPNDRRPILPGSGLKGAVRTALLDRINGGRRHGQIDEWARTKNDRELSSQNGPLQQRLLEGAFELDPLRLIAISDAAAAPSTGTEIRFAINRRKRQRDSGEARPTQAEDKGLYQLLEAAQPLQYRAFRGMLTRQDVGGLAATRSRGGEARQQLPKAELHWPVADIARACHRFYFGHFERENALLAAQGLVDPQWHEAATALIALHAEDIAAGRAFLLRVGRHSGAESVTLDGVRHIKILKGRDPTTGRQAHDYDFEAHTLWPAADGKDAHTGLMPFGWLLVELVPSGQAPVARPEGEKLVAGWAAGRQARASADAPQPAVAPVEDVIWPKAQIKFNGRSGTFSAVGPDGKEVHAPGDAGLALLNSLPEPVQRKLRQNQFVRAKVTVRGRDILAVESP